MTTHSSTTGRLATFALAVVALLALTLGTYIGAYQWLGRVSTISTPAGATAIERNYPHRWQMHLFRPAAKVESWWREIDVQSVYGPIAGKGSHDQQRPEARTA